MVQVGRICGGSDLTEPTPRQVLYALVSGGFLLVVALLTIGAAVAGLVPGWWTGIMGVSLVSTAAWSSANWRRTGPVLALSIGLFMIWAAGTLALG